MSRVVLVTGVSRDVAARMARSLAGVEGFEVVGIDLVPPRRDLGRAKFVRADLRSPLLGRTLAKLEPDTVVHAALSDDLSGAHGKELNVLGSMQLFAACQSLPAVRHVVAISSGSVYGSSASGPARVSEDAELPSSGRSPFGRDAAEMESYLKGLSEHRPDIRTTTLRFAAVLGAEVDSRLGRFLSLPVVPKPMGFDARMQFLHPFDAVDVCRHVVTEAIAGVFNVAAADALPLTRVLRIMGRPSVGVARSWAPALIEAGGVHRAGTRIGAGELREVTYGRVMDVTRLEAAGFTAHYSSARTVEEFAAFGTPGLFSAANVDRATRAIDGLGAAMRTFRRRRDG